MSAILANSAAMLANSPPQRVMPSNAVTDYASSPHRACLPPSLPSLLSLPPLILYHIHHAARDSLSATAS